MKSKFTKTFMALLLVMLIAVCSAVPAFALSWNGSSAGGGGAGTAAGPKGYAIRTTEDNCIGYRFSVVNKSGGTKVTTSIDVFRNTTYGNSQCTAGYKFTTKYNKKQLKDNQNGNYSTSQNSSNCYYEKNMGFQTGLPAPDGIKNWQNIEKNLNRVLLTLGINGIDALKNGDKILVEPIYDVRLESVYHALTVTEIAIYGKYILGANSDGGSSSTSASWGFISSYVNKHYPNALYTPDGMSLWTNASTLSKRATFYTMINSGYGVGIAYTETKSDFSPNLTVNLCEAWPGTKSTRNNNHFGISTGNTFAYWTYGHDYPTNGSTIWYAVNFPAETENCYVKQSVWVVGGGSTSRNVWSNSNQWYDVSLSPTTLNSGHSSITVKARVDWIESNGTVKKYGTEKTFYIPIKPDIIAKQIDAIAIDGVVMGTATNAKPTAETGVYVGQRITSKYSFGTNNTWNSYNRLLGDMYRHNGSYYQAVNGNDVYVDNRLLSSHSMTSSEYRVAKISNDNYKLRYMTTTNWNTDIAHTTRYGYFDIPVVIPDVAITDIKLVDADGYYVDHMNLEYLQKVTPQYTYKNNTSVRVYVQGYSSDNSVIDGIYAIDPGESITVNGKEITIPNSRSYTVRGSVYLEGAGYDNAAWESDGANNKMELSCTVNHPLKLLPVTPNAPYRENTDVITSYWINNKYDLWYTGNYIAVRFNVYNANGSLITSQTKTNIPIAPKEGNFIYFKWRVPNGVSSNVRIEAILLDRNVAQKPKIHTWTTTPYTMYQTPDTTYEKNAPSGSYGTGGYSASSNGYAWYEYFPTSQTGKFEKRYFSVILYGTSTTIAPATGETHEMINGKWKMKSGYGFSLETVINSISVSGGTSSIAYTYPQYALALYPEYNYAVGAGKCTTLIKTGNKATLPAFKNYGEVHFTPVWYKNGNYTPNVRISDCWTPAGMLTAYSIPTPINIDGNMFDDWYIGRR